MGSLFHLQGIFPTQGWNPGLPHCRWILYQLSHQGNPEILEWVAYPFSSGFPWPRNRTGVSCTVGRFFSNWATRKAHKEEIRLHRLMTILLLLLTRFSHVWLCATPQTAAHKAPPFLGFSRQEHWSGLPFPSPMHESEKWKWKVKVKSLSRVRPLATPWTVAHQAPPSMGFSRQEYWSGVPLPSPMMILRNG